MIKPSNPLVRIREELAALVLPLPPDSLLGGIAFEQMEGRKGDSMKMVSNLAQKFMAKTRRYLKLFMIPSKFGISDFPRSEGHRNSFEGMFFSVLL